MMLPGMTISPPYFLTPKRRPALSRPLREEPPAFLCAIPCPPSHLVMPGLDPGIHVPLLGDGRVTPGHDARLVLAPGADFSNAQHGLVLAVAVLAPVVLPPL